MSGASTGKRRARRMCRGAVVVLLACSWSQAGTIQYITVNTEADEVGVQPGPQDDVISLREAIQWANTAADPADSRVINFASNVHQITISFMLGDLDPINSPVGLKIDGAGLVTVSGEVDNIGQNLVGGLVVQSSGTTIQGLALTNFASPAITVNGSDARILSNNIHSNVDTAVKVFGNNAQVDHNAISTNAGEGVAVLGSEGTQVTHNTIQSNDGNGVYLADALNGIVSANQISNNRGDGVRVESGSSGNQITGNTITGDHGNGVTLVDPSAANPVRGNSISSHDGLGIDVNDDGVTANSTSFDHQNFPELDSVTYAAGQITITGHLNAPTGTYVLEFFSNALPNPAGYGEGETYLKLKDPFTVTVDASHSATFSAVIPGNLLQAGQVYFTATATSNGGLGATSEFSAAMVAKDWNGQVAAVPLPAAAWSGLALGSLVFLGNRLARRTRRCR